MAEKVEIDIPGVGLIEAKNAASEKTLSEILKILEEFQRKSRKPGGPGGPGGGGGQPGGAAGAPTGFVNSLKKAATNVSQKAKFLGGAFIGLGQMSANATASLANLGDSIESVASMFSSLPVVGTLFQAAASAAERVVKSFNSASQSGASFGGSLNSFVSAATQAGMTMTEFGDLIRSSGQGMLAFGSTVESGAKRFVQISKQLRATGSDLYALGFSTAEINKGLASYGELMRMQGLQGKKSNSELAAGANRYLKNLDALAKITGEERSAKEAELKALAASAQFQASMAGLSEEVRESFALTVTGLPKELQGFTEDLLATGTATTEENQLLLSQMGESGAYLQQLHAKMQRGEAVTAEERNRLNNLIKKEAPAALQSIKQAAAANSALAPLAKGLAAAQRINTDAVLEATEEQKKAKKETDQVNEAINKMRERIAAVSNSFTMFLVNSGALDQMMKAFELLVGVIQKFAIPIINLMIGAITIAIDVISKNVNPAFRFLGEVAQTVGDIIDQYVKPALLNLAGFIIADVWPVLKFLGKSILSLTQNVIWPAFQMIGGVIRDYVYPAFSAVAGFLADNLFPILTMLGAGFAAYYAVLIGKQIAEIYSTAKTWLMGGAAATAAFNLGLTAKAAFAAALPFIKIVAPIIALVGLFAYLYKSGWSFGDALESIGDNLKRFAIEYVDIWLSIAEKIAKFFGGGDKIVAIRKGLDLQRKELDEKEAERDQRRADRAKERGFQNRQNIVDEMSLKLGEKQLGQQQEQIRNAEKAEELNLSDPYGLLKGLAKKEGSELVQNAEGPRRAIEGQAEQRAREEQQRQQQQQQQPPDQPPQQRRPTDQEILIASVDRLNTNMERMIALQARSNILLNNQLSVQQDLTGAVSGDLFAYPSA